MDAPSPLARKKFKGFRRARWYDEHRSPMLAECLPDEPNIDEPRMQLMPVGWCRFEMSQRLSPEMVTPMRFRVTEPPDTSKADNVVRVKNSRKRGRGTTSMSKVGVNETDRRVFALRLKPTTEQKHLFQRAFSIARLAKKLAHKQLGDQRQKITKKHINSIKKAVCSEMVQERERVDPDDPKNGKVTVTGRRQNTTLPPSTRRVLFEQHLAPKDRLCADVRCNAVIKFCQAVKSTQAQIAERQAEWDNRARAHQRYLVDGHTRSTGVDGRKLWTTKQPPKGERPEMKPRQVRWPDRNRPKHSFSVDAKTSSKNNPFTVRWDSAECRDEGAVMFMKQKLRLWGCPSKRRRELDRLTERMCCHPDNVRKPVHQRRKEQASRRQAMLKYDNGRYYLMVQCLSDKVEPRDPEFPRFVGLDPGVRTFLSAYDDQGRFGDIGRHQIRRVLVEARKGDGIKSKLDKDGTRWSKRRRKKARKLVRRHNQKCNDLKADAHWKTARALCERYDHILLPKFNSAAAMKVLGSRTTRQMCLWSHFEFRQRLQHKAQQFGTRAHLCSEHSTTIACGRCLWVEETMVRNPTERFHCGKCDYGIGRDDNAARNITIMNAERCIGELESIPIDD